MRWSWLARCLLCVVAVNAQDSSSAASQSRASNPATASSPSVSLSATTSSHTIVSTSRNGDQTRVMTTVIPTTFDVTYTPTQSSASASSSGSSPPSASESPQIVLETKLDPAFGVLGAILILTGLPSAFWGHKNRWTSFFLIGFYTFSLTCFVLILKFGILPAINPPSKTLRGMFVLASSIAGLVGGGIAIFFWKAARYCIGAWGGLALGWWIQCFHDGGLITNVGMRWVLYIGCAVVGFVLCTIPKIHYHILLLSTAFVGSSAFMLGVDCYTTAGLKEFYVWNLGFMSLFPKYTSRGIKFPVSQTMQIELGLIGAIALMGAAVQLRILNVLQAKLREIQLEQKKRDEEAEISAASRFTSVFKERDAWEKEHGHDRVDSAHSTMPLMKDQDGSSTPVTPDWSDLSGSKRGRYHSNVSEFMASPMPDDEQMRHAASAGGSQRAGALPALDLGLGIEDDVPASFISKDVNGPPTKKPLTALEIEDAKRKEELLAEIHSIRRSIDALKGETPDPSSSAGSRRPSLTSRRTLSIDANSALLPPVQSHLRPPRAEAPRGRIHSMELSTLANSNMIGESISRPTSAPLRDLDWDDYVQERKLLQPPAGITPPIGGSRIQMSPAVAGALEQRKRRESSMAYGTDSSDEIPVGYFAQGHGRSHSAGSATMLNRPSPSGGTPPVQIMPPKKIAAPQPRRPSQPVRTKTFEELAERHREKMRDLQAPVTAAEREHAELASAKQRWERSKAMEKEAVTRRQAEKHAEFEKRGRLSVDDGLQPDRRRRSGSADKLTGKRLSTMKVQDWQKYQNTSTPSGPSGGVPFPEGKQRRRSRDMLT